MHVPPTDTSTGSANLAQSFESCIRVDRTIAVESGVIVETMEEDEYRFGLELRKLTDREEEEATLDEKLPVGVSAHFASLLGEKLLRE
jgi:hypothetical protein